MRIVYCAKIIVLSLLVAVATHIGLGHVTAEELDRVTLKDGGVILGQVVDMID